MHDLEFIGCGMQTEFSRRPRKLVVQVLNTILQEKVTLPHAWESMARTGSFPEEHRAWAREMVAGILRYKGRLDWIIDTYSLKKKPSGFVRKALYLGVYPLIAQNEVVPAKIVSEVVGWAKSEKGEQPAKFINAVLRQISESKDQWKNWKPGPQASKEEKQAWASLPAWMWDRLVTERGEEWTLAYGEASLSRPQFWKLKKDTKPEKIADFSTLDFASDLFIQDISSQELILKVSAVLKDKKCKRVLDLCAAPGGKSVGLAWQGFQVDSTDESVKRLSKLNENSQRLGLQDQITVLERSKLRDSDPYDAVWVDAPCTGSGTLRKGPEIRWIRDEKDLAPLLQLQQDLLKEALELLKPGGVLVYSVCSVLKEEGQAALIEKASSGKKHLTSIEFDPQTEPFGDGFQAAIVFKK